MPQHQNTVVLVTGASRGAGRGIALQFGETGATVYVTGRSVSGGFTTDDVPGTIDDCAREVTARGGRGIAVRCDHTIDSDIEALFEQVRAEQGRLDVLVNNVWGGYEDSQCRPLPRVPFWEQSFDHWDRMFTAGVRAHLVASRLAVPLMLPQRRGLIATTTAHLEPLPYLKNIFYDMSKYSVARMTWAMARELREHGIAAVAVAPGFMRTERVEEAFRRAGAIEALNGPGGPKETTAYLGRAIVALAADPRVLEKSGQVLEVGTLALEYQFTDVDGSQPPPFRISGAGERLRRSADGSDMIGSQMGTSEVDAIARELLAAFDGQGTIQSIAERRPGFDWEDAYRIGAALCALRRARGERPIGRKIGFTNRNIWAQYGATAPIWGAVYDSTVIHAVDGRADVSLRTAVRPRLEPEIAFKLARALPAGLSEPVKILEHVEWVAASFEIVDCHFADWKFQAADAVADFSLHWRLVLGTPLVASATELSALAVQLHDCDLSLRQNGSVVASGTGANALGHPAMALAHLADVLAGQPEADPLEAGEIITTGTLTPAMPIRAGETWRSTYAGIALAGLTVSFSGA